MKILADIICFNLLFLLKVLNPVILCQFSVSLLLEMSLISDLFILFISTLLFVYQTQFSQQVVPFAIIKKYCLVNDVNFHFLNRFSLLSH